MNLPGKLLLFPCCFLFLIVTVVASQATTSCHCFQERNFDPFRPEATDPFLLATTQNSLMAATLNVPRKNIVSAKMAGVNADLLWISYYLSARTGLEVAEIIALYSAFDSGWTQFAANLAKHADKLDQPFIVALARPLDLSGLARGAFHSVMVSQFGMDQELLDRIDLSGADRQEQIMAIFLSLVLAIDPIEIIHSVSTGQQSWGAILASSGHEPQQIESVWGKLSK